MVGMSAGKDNGNTSQRTVKRLVISALALSEPGTMGGNSKIALEMARCLAPCMDVHFMLPRHKLPTLVGTLGDCQLWVLVWQCLRRHRHGAECHEYGCK